MKANCGHVTATPTPSLYGYTRCRPCIWEDDLYGMYFCNRLAGYIDPDSMTFVSCDQMTTLGTITDITTRELNFTPSGGKYPSIRFTVKIKTSLAPSPSEKYRTFYGQIKRGTGLVTLRRAD